MAPEREELSVAEVEEAARTGVLDLSGRELSELPAKVAQLDGLHTLRLDDNQLTELPPEIGQLSSLQTLRLDNNKLTDLPPEIGRLSGLQTLSLVDNHVVQLPVEIGQLAKLETLRLDNNQLADLPVEIGQLSYLWEFTAARNQLSSLPAQIGWLTRLFRVRFDSNQLTALPSEFGRLADLSLVWLFDNQLCALPPEIGNLTKLRELRLERNSLKTLPRQLADRIDAGLDLRLEGNPLQEPLPEFVARGASALATYLRSLEDAVPRYEAKLLLVGEGNVGKSSLVSALRNEPFVPNRPTTHGIEIQPLILRHPNLDVDMTVRAWDFGGQEVYRVTHQFFFSRRALYLVVWNAREGQEQDEVEGWLRRIRLRVSRDTRVMVVATHCDERRPELDYPALQKAFPTLLFGGRPWEVDNKTRSGIPDLQRGIATAAAGLPQMGQLISSRWTEARDEILAHTKPQMLHSEFAQICQKHRVEGDEISGLAELMHDLGQIVYYGEDEGLRDFVVLKPEWLTKAISYVLEDKETREHDGVLDHARLAEILHSKEEGSPYPEGYNPYFLRLMEKFDVSYRLEDEDDNEKPRSLVAQLVPYDRPALPWETNTELRRGVRSLSLVCKLSEPAPGLIAWLTVRHHRASKKYWRNGVFLEHPVPLYASEALLELRVPDQLSIDVRAPSPDLYFHVLRDSVEDLIRRRWPGITYRLNVPCPTVLPEGQRCCGQFPLEALVSFREQGAIRVPCYECHVNQDLSELLTGFAQAEPTLEPELERLSRQVDGVRDGVERLSVVATELAASMRRVLKAAEVEITDCPRLFTLSEEGRSRLRIQHHYRLVLWCEHPGHWHPWTAACYQINQPKSWLVQFAPYASLVFKALQLVVPVAASLASMVLTPDQLAQAQQEISGMTALVGDLPVKNVHEDGPFMTDKPTSQLTAAEGAAARALRVLLFEHDHNRVFGGLHRVFVTSGDIAWVCNDHYSYYDPGLPVIPGSAPLDRASMLPQSTPSGMGA